MLDLDAFGPPLLEALLRLELREEWGLTVAGRDSFVAATVQLSLRPEHNLGLLWSFSASTSAAETPRGPRWPLRRLALELSASHGPGLGDSLVDRDRELVHQLDGVLDAWEEA